MLFTLPRKGKADCYIIKCSLLPAQLSVASISLPYSLVVPEGHMSNDILRLMP